ncbi:MAG: hypothetical protein P9L94_06160 [Candidatus Hinthialibacter antarcticus]|nr:hypothetical protein [Candidatus Hinthialibacter antarcticus]
MDHSKIILMGQDDATFLGYGWFGVERSPEDVLFRAAGKQAIFRLPLTADRVELAFLAAARPLHAGEPLQFGINRDGERLITWTLHTNGWTVRCGVIERYSGEDLMLEADNPWSPDKLYQNGDSRLLSVLVSSIRVSFV